MDHPRRSQPVLYMNDELITEILSFLPVKSLVRFRCVSKTWNSHIFNPVFVKRHLHRSPKNAHFVLYVSSFLGWDRQFDRRIMTCSKSSFLFNQSHTIAVAGPNSIQLKNKYWFVGSCNGLVCLNGRDYLDSNGSSEHRFREYWVRFLNPATRLRSKKSPRFRFGDGGRDPTFGFGYDKWRDPIFGFGYDKSNEAYKVVALLPNLDITYVKVYTRGDHCWRDIQSFHAFPIPFRNEGKFVSGYLNWLAVSGYGPGGRNQLGIISLDLENETYKQLLLPDGLDESAKVQPALAVLMDCLCFCHNYQTSHFVVWQMKEFGVEKSWTRFINVSYDHLQVKRKDYGYFHIQPLCISENGDSLVLREDVSGETILYNRRDNSVEHNDDPLKCTRTDVKDYVPSLIPPSWN